MDAAANNPSRSREAVRVVVLEHPWEDATSLARGGAAIVEGAWFAVVSATATCQALCDIIRLLV